MTVHNQKTLTAQQKANAALETVRGIRPIDEIAQKYGVDPAQLRQWERELTRKAAGVFAKESLPGPGRVPGLRAPKKMYESHVSLETRIAQLTSDQMQINQALVLKIFECQCAEDALLQSENRLRQFVAHQEQIREDERKRIARDIHDELGQNLMVLRIDTSMLHARTAHSHHHLHERVGVALDNIDATIKSVRSIINDLRPFELELGLQAAVEWQLKRFEKKSGIVCQLSIDQPTFSDALGEEQTLAIFRILQESLSNIARHSHATRAEIMLSWHGHTFSMRVKDNGVGIDPDDRRKAKSFGILGIKERVSSLGGELVIESNDGNGTVLSINIPVEKGNPA